VSIFDVTRSDIQTVTFIAEPARSFSSSSAGVTGSVFVMARRSRSEKDAGGSPAFVDDVHDDSGAGSLLKAVQEAGFQARLVSGSFFAQAAAYMDGVDALGASERNLAALQVRRLVPSSSQGPAMAKKMVAKDLLAPWHRPSCPSAHWAVPNYHSLNFFTSSTVVTGGVFLYPNVAGGPTHDGHVTGVYALSGGFTFGLSINPRYRPDQADRPFHAGTIFHMSSSYALSLVSGSARDHNGRVAAFRLQLQLSHSADIAPSRAVPGTAPGDLVFLSDDNSLDFNRWHRVVVRWGTQYVNDGTGSFNIDGVDRGTFVVPSGTIMPRVFTGREGPAVLAVGNFVDVSNSGSQAIAPMFGPTLAFQQGLRQLWASDASPDVSLAHPLNAELHDLSIRRAYTSNDEIAASGSQAPGGLSEYGFYLPPFFRQASPLRRVVSGAGGVPCSPYQLYDGSTEDPFNVLMAFSVDGHHINVENFACDLANDLTPFMPGVAFYPLTSLADKTVPANRALYTDSFTRRRNLVVLPCDDGTWQPNFDLIGSCLTGSRHASAPGHPDPMMIRLDDLLSTSSLLFGPVLDDATGSQETMAAALLGITPEAPGASPGPALASRFAQTLLAISAGTYTPSMHREVPTTVHQRTREASSNSVVMFDVSNLFYGTRILPGSLVLSEPATTGSGGAMSMTLRDDGQGGIYRADCESGRAVWNSVGTVFYGEGLIVLRHPVLALFGNDGFEVSFRGERPVHVMHVDVMAPAGRLNSSSNPAYRELRPSGAANDPDTGFVYLTGINFHDENMNVIARAVLAQPIVKRFGDRLGFRVRVDW